MAEQTYANHRRYVPGYHWVTAGFVMVAVIFAVKWLAGSFTTANLIALLSALGLFGTTFYARFFAMKVQDRVIRMEERERMNRLLPNDLKARIDELRIDQVVSLRFASDGELPDLVKRTLAGEFATPDAIKRAIKNWRPDYARA